MHNLVTYLGCLVGAFEPLSHVRPEKLGVMLRLLKEFLSSFSCGQVRDVQARDLSDEIAQEIVQAASMTARRPTAASDFFDMPTQ